MEQYNNLYTTIDILHVFCFFKQVNIVMQQPVNANHLNQIRNHIQYV